jgi:hypothetical protein
MIKKNLLEKKCTKIAMLYLATADDPCKKTLLWHHSQPSDQPENKNTAHNQLMLIHISLGTGRDENVFVTVSWVEQKKIKPACLSSKLSKSIFIRPNYR